MTRRRTLRPHRLPRQTQCLRKLSVLATLHFLIPAQVLQVTLVLLNTADAQNPAIALKLALKEHTDSHYQIHHDFPRPNELAELKIDPLEQIVDAVVKTQRDLSRNGQVRLPENFVAAIHHGLQFCSKYDCLIDSSFLVVLCFALARNFVK